MNILTVTSSLAFLSLVEAYRDQSFLQPDRSSSLTEIGSDNTKPLFDDGSSSSVINDGSKMFIKVILMETKTKKRSLEPFLREDGHSDLLKLNFTTKKQKYYNLVIADDTNNIVRPENVFIVSSKPKTHEAESVYLEPSNVQNHDSSPWLPMKPKSNPAQSVVSGPQYNMENTPMNEPIIQNSTPTPKTPAFSYVQTPPVYPSMYTPNPKQPSNIYDIINSPDQNIVRKPLKSFYNIAGVKQHYGSKLIVTPSPLRTNLIWDNDIKPKPVRYLPGTPKIKVNPFGKLYTKPNRIKQPAIIFGTRLNFASSASRKAPLRLPSKRRPVASLPLRTNGNPTYHYEESAVSLQHAYPSPMTLFYFGD